MSDKKLDRIYREAPNLAFEAVNLGHVEVLQLLHQEGVQLNASMLFKAQANNDLPMLQTLLEAGVDAYTQYEKKLSVIDYCLEQGDTNEEAMALLFKYGAKSFANKKGQKPEDILSIKKSNAMLTKAGLFSGNSGNENSRQAGNTATFNF